MQAIRVALLIPDRITLNGVEVALAAIHTYKAIGFEDFGALFSQGRNIHILLIDISDLGIGEIEARLQRLADCCPNLRVIVISSHLKVMFVRRVMQLGVKGYIYREDLADTLISSLDVVRFGNVTFSAKVLELLTFSDQLYAVNDLKPLDFRVLRLSAQGEQVKEIAAALNISQRSVYRSREKLKEILDVDSLVALIEAAREQGLLDD